MQSINLFYLKRFHFLHHLLHRLYLRLPFCKDQEKYEVVEDIKKEIEKSKKEKIKIDNQEISEILTVNGIRFSFKDGSWGLIRASSNKPSLVVVTESPTSDERKLKIFYFIDELLKKTGKIGEYDQKI